MIKTNKSINPSAFKNRAKEAVFWERNFKQAWDSGKPVKLRVSRNLSEMINVRLDPKTIDYVRQEADKKGIGPTQLIRMWIRERIDQPRSPAVTV